MRRLPQPRGAPVAWSTQSHRPMMSPIKQNGGGTAVPVIEIDGRSTNCCAHYTAQCDTLQVEEFQFSTTKLG